MTPGNMERRYRISEGAPNDFTKATVRISDIFDATRNFLDENFRGAIEASGEISSDGYAIISPNGLAYFFKILLNAVFGESMVFMKMSTKDNVFVMETSWKHHRDINAEDISELESIARVSGFTPEFMLDGEICRISISLEIKKEKQLVLYAVPIGKMHAAYIRVFFL